MYISNNKLTLSMQAISSLSKRLSLTKFESQDEILLEKFLNFLFTFKSFSVTFIAKLS